MTLKIEAASASDELTRAVEASVQAVTRLKARLEVCPAGSLSRDGKVIEDVRDYGGRS